MIRNGTLALVLFVSSCAALRGSDESQIGTEVAIPVHLQDGDEYQRSAPQLVEFGRKLFTARWTIQEGAGRPRTKGTGMPLADEQSPLVFPRNFNRISGTRYEFVQRMPQFARYRRWRRHRCKRVCSRPAFRFRNL